MYTAVVSLKASIILFEACIARLVVVGGGVSQAQKPERRILVVGTNDTMMADDKGATKVEAPGPTEVIRCSSRVRSTDRADLTLSYTSSLRLEVHLHSIEAGAIDGSPETQAFGYLIDHPKTKACAEARDTLAVEERQ